METSGQFGDLVADLVKRENRAVRRSFVYTGIALLLSGLWLGYTVYKTRQLSEQAQALQTQIAAKQSDLKTKDEELAAKQKKLESVNAILALSPDELIELYNFGWKNNYLANTESNRVKIRESLQANAARTSLASSTDNSKREGIVLEYFPKDVDRKKVTAALEELGFTLDTKESVNSLRTNAIWFGRQVDPADAKLVAFTLIRAGVELQEIRHFRRNSPRANSSVIQVGTNPYVLQRPALTVDNINNLNFAEDR